MFEHFSKEARDERRAEREATACWEIRRVLSHRIGLHLDFEFKGNYDNVNMDLIIANTGMGRALETKDCDFTLNSLGGVVCDIHTVPNVETEPTTVDVS